MWIKRHISSSNHSQSVNSSAFLVFFDLLFYFFFKFDILDTTLVCTPSVILSPIFEQRCQYLTPLLIYIHNIYSFSHFQSLLNIPSTHTSFPTPDVMTHSYIQITIFSHSYHIARKGNNQKLSPLNAYAHHILILPKAYHTFFRSILIWLNENIRPLDS